jgi:branched-chain amino acid transport system ATP-binding protein
VGRVLEITGLRKEFGGLVAVDDLGFAVDEGQLVGLIGPNGAGKTTVFNLVTGHLRPTAGEVRFRGQRVTGLPPWEIVQRGLARTFQSTVLFGESSVLENVLRGCALRAPSGRVAGFLGSRREEGMRARAHELLSFVELEAVQDERARNLPYGHQRALGVAIALASQPQVLMLDEPVAGMNPEETQRMAALIRRVNAAGTSIVVVEHDMSFVMQLCRHIVVMNHGRKIAEGAPEAIRTNEAVVVAYLGVDDDAVA